MKIQFAKTNTKGQIVIPKAFRDSLGINSDVPLQLELIPEAVVIRPLAHSSHNNARKTYREMLKETQGAWGPGPSQDTSLRKSELDAADKAKKAW